MKALPRLALCTAALLAGCAGAPHPAPTSGTHSAAADTLWLDRLTWGASSADLAAVRAKGREAWLDAQLKPVSPAALPDAAKAQVQALAVSQQALLPLVQQMEAQRKAADALTDDMLGSLLVVDGLNVGADRPMTTQCALRTSFK